MLTTIQSAGQIFRLSVQNKIYDSGVLLIGGQYILTAAHLFIDNPRISDIMISNAVGQRVAYVTQLFIHPNWRNDPSSYNNDLALIKLDRVLEGGYDIYRGNAEIGQVFTRIGYSGTQLVEGKNTYDAYSDIINSLYVSNVSPKTQLLYDYDDGTAQHDALGVLFGINQLGVGAQESLSQKGLSGAPTFINNQIAGIGSYIFRANVSDTNSIVDSSVGEMGSDMRVSVQADWIDYVTHGNALYTLPTTQAEVMTRVPEPNYGTVVNYFLAAFSEPLKGDISFDYRTLDGSATAGGDYEATQGHISLTAGDDHVVIPVTILGDKLAEADETFQLEVSHPVGFSLPHGALTLIAVHTIVDNDVLV